MNDLILLSFLGTGGYQPTTYVWGDKRHETAFFSAAANAFFSPVRILVAMTPEAEQKHGEAIGKQLSHLEKIAIPTGANEAELWEMFSALIEAVPEKARLIIDVTHGFRSQPMLALAIAVYLRAAKKVAVERIVYGAFEARNQEMNTSPMFELTQFLELMDWAREFQDFERFGHANQLRDHLRRLQGDIRNNVERNQAPTSLQGLGNQLDMLTDALALVRPKQTIEVAQRIIDNILVNAEGDANAHPSARPLLLLLHRLPNVINPMRSTDLFSREGFQAQAAMIRFYLNTEQYMQAVTLAREAFVSKSCALNGDNPSDITCRRNREDIINEEAYNIRNGATNFSNQAAANIQLWAKIRDLRNDLNHAGMNETPVIAHTAIQQAKDYAEKVAKFIEQ